MAVFAAAAAESPRRPAGKQTDSCKAAREGERRWQRRSEKKKKRKRHRRGANLVFKCGAGTLSLRAPAGRSLARSLTRLLASLQFASIRSTCFGGRAHAEGPTFGQPASQPAGRLVGRSVGWSAGRTDRVRAFVYVIQFNSGRALAATSRRRPLRARDFEGPKVGGRDQA